MPKKVIGYVISALNFSKKERARIAKEINTASINKKIFFEHAKFSPTVKNFKIPGQSKGRPAHIKAATQQVLEGTDGTEKEKDRFFNVYRDTVIHYIEKKQKNLQKLLKNVECEKDRLSTKKTFQIIFENSKKYNVTYKAIEELYELWGFERVKNKEDIFPLIKNNGSSETKEEIEQIKEHHFPKGLPNHYNGDNKAKKGLKVFLEISTPNINQLFQCALIKENFSRSRILRKGETHKSLHHLYGFPDFRRDAYKIVLNAAHRKGERNLKNYFIRSFEYISFKNYKNTTSNSRFTESSLKDLCEIDSAINSHLKKEYKSLDSLEPDALKKIFKGHLLLWKDAKKDIKIWKNLEEAQRQILVNVLFSLGTLLNSIAPIKIAIKTIPEIEHYLLDLINIHEKNISSGEIFEDKIDSEEDDKVKRDEETTWEDLAGDLVEVSKIISTEKPNKQHIEKLGNIHLDLLNFYERKFSEKGKEVEINLDKIKTSLKEYKNELLALGKAENYIWLKQKTLDQIFRKWKIYISDIKKEDYTIIFDEVNQSKIESINLLEQYFKNEQTINELENKIKIKTSDALDEIEARGELKALKKDLHAKEELSEELITDIYNQASPPNKTQIPSEPEKQGDNQLNSGNENRQISVKQSRSSESLKSKENMEIDSENNFSAAVDTKKKQDSRTKLKPEKAKPAISNDETFEKNFLFDHEVTGKEATEGFLNINDGDEIHQKNALWYMLKEGQLNYAYWFAHSLEENNISNLSVPSSLLKAVALANKVYDPLGDSNLIYGENLNKINETEIRNLISADANFEEIRFLVLSAFLQPSFVGHHHPNLELMQLVNVKLPNSVLSLFNTCFQFTKQTKSDFSFLYFPTDKSERELIKNNKRNIKELIQSYEDKPGNYQEKVWIKDLIKNEFAPLVKIVEKDLRDRKQEVKDLIDKYHNRDTLVDLVQSNHQFKQRNRDNPHHIYDLKKSYLGNTVNKCRNLLNEGKIWLGIVNRSNSEKSTDLIKDFSSDFKNFYKSAKVELTELRDNSNDLARFSCINLFLGHLKKLSDAINRKNQSFGPSINDWFELPKRLESNKNNTSPLALSLAKIAHQNFNFDDALKSSISEGDFAVAEVLLSEQKTTNPGRKELNKFEANIKKGRESFKKKLEGDVEKIQALVDDAYGHSIIDETDYSIHYSKIEEARAKEHEKNPRYPHIIESLEAIKNDIEAQKKGALDEWHNQSNKLLEELNSREDLKDRRNEIENYEYSIEKAFKDKNITVISEQIISLKEFLKDSNQPLYVSEKCLHVEFEEFFNKQDDIFDECKGKNQNQIKDFIHHVRFKYLDFSGHKENPPTNEIRAWSGIASTSISRNLDEGQKTQVCKILNGLGIQEISPDSIKDVEHGAKLNLIKVQVKISKGESPFPIFGSKANGQYYFVISKTKSFSAIHSFLKDHNIYSENSAIIVLVMDDFDSTLRSEFTEYSLKNKLSIIVVDRILFLFLLSLSEDSNESCLKKFFKVTLPFTYNNPYQEKVGDTVPEMIFGREKEINDLMKIPGVAIIFGGRQLGKTTLLQEAKNRFHNPENGQFFISGPSLKHYRGKDLRYIRWDFWQKIGDQLAYENLLEKNQNYQFEDIANFLKKRVDLTILFSFDEIDDFLKEDDKHGFPICSDLKQLISETGERFKVLMAGLLSVQRFSGRPNSPLYQLGVARNIGMLDKRTAMELIQVPFAFAGYIFDDASVAAILAYTNRHPGLIQVFCYYLMEYLRAQRINKMVAPSNSPGYKITQENISSLQRKSEISDAIKNRFQMTIDLHDQGKVIIYAVIVEGIQNGFYPIQAKELGEFWWKEGFRDVDTASVKIILDEMLGLGVLSKTEGKDTVYSLRSPNITRHLGSQKEVENILEDFKPSIAGNHTYNHRLSQSGQLSPCEESHELVITGHKYIESIFEQRNEDSELRNEDRFTKFTITGIFGSDALGFLGLKDSFSTLSEFEGSKPYKVFEYPEVNSIKPCLKWLKQKLTETKKNNSIVLMIHMPSAPEHKELYSDLINEVESSFTKESFQNYTRLIFLFNPEATWNWLGLENYREFEEKISFITLRRFHEEAIVRLLRDLKLLYAEDHVNDVIKRTGGWFDLLRKYPEMANRHNMGDDPMSFRGLEDQIPEFPQPGDATNFLKQQGLGCDGLPFAIPLLNEIIELSDIGQPFWKIENKIEIQNDLLEECIEEYNTRNKEELDLVQVREWYSRMGIIKKNPGKRNDNIDRWCIDKRTKVCLDISKTS